ncbi:AMIN domain-containing protein [Campylobacter sp. RM16192]|uniref:AMIN domain-containing protein n=1 Tax=Campylobacter sp. RM16192 TaxID=1660080 RepID=UPI0014510DFC|nr:AMIN domain-containing protein [Campylobacter sp. RM16192]QCD51805.1 putative periplasmic protein (AMIN domain) [Campylobacter sp. RM16192]
MRQIWFLILFLGFCFGRENPFISAGKLNTNVVTTNVVETLAPFDKQHIKFPSDTKEFISLTLKYKNLDGSIKEKIIYVNRSIDWQDEFVLMKVAVPSVVTKTDVSVTKDEPKITIKTIKKDENTTIKEVKEEIKQEVKIDENFTKQEPLKDVVIIPVENIEKDPIKTINFRKMTLEVDLMQIKFLTSDKKIRDFKIYRDNKIVIDFDNSLNFYTKTFKIDCGSFKSITLGAHDKFYRATINLDKNYKYTIENIANGYILKVNK